MFTVSAELEMRCHMPADNCIRFSVKTRPGKEPHTRVIIVLDISIDRCRRSFLEQLRICERQNNGAIALTSTLRGHIDRHYGARSAIHLVSDLANRSAVVVDRKIEHRASVRQLLLEPSLVRFPRNWMVGKRNRPYRRFVRPLPQQLAVRLSYSTQTQVTNPHRSNHSLSSASINQRSRVERHLAANRR